MYVALVGDIIARLENVYGKIIVIKSALQHCLVFPYRIPTTRALTLRIRTQQWLYSLVWR